MTTAIGTLDRKRLPAGSVLVVGAGLAGLYLALKLAPRPVYVLTSRRSSKGAASAWAQGGIAAALSNEDSPESHASDTIAAGDGLVDPAIARLVAEQGASRVRDLDAMGVPFDRNEQGELYLSLEAAHSLPRVARVKGDTAGREIITVMVKHAQAADHIEGLIGWRAESLLLDAHGGIAGALARQDDGALLALEADVTVLATGGVGGLFSVTTNPRTARGDALGMAAVVGAELRDMEFVQFHPTAIDIGRDPAPLATEALRGEGATLVNANGRRFMQKYSPQGELAPRDDVARAIFAEIQAGRPPFLDCRATVGSHFPEEFPTVFESCMSAGIDPRTELIPVAPAVHYHMGGVATDSFGQSSLPGLYAIGECAATGLHGANRLASNSLLEAVVFGGRAAEHINSCTLPERRAENVRVQPWLSMGTDVSQSLRNNMTELCGVRRSAAGLNRLLDIIDGLIGRVGRANPLIASHMIAAGALAREESRGGHYREDFAEESPTSRSSFLTYDRLE
ncbi:L-aspartate oxidase [Algimonas ampicilliniresistens]|uniref:L-aspartate oxidase n=1 Tax=Algimonas ampicilliniresistens TaxID=1298735 RepID=A0ABQ5V7L9_9PROT|nr:L-aspartate oxidase [Algimonas ampicilliniresistens]GLQ22853.1 L-aspartate oxidase [Algimonas ampicilliniresistens]